MSVTRGSFILKCDHSGCRNYIELETFDFDDAIVSARREKRDNGWTTIARGTKYIDICPSH